MPTLSLNITLLQVKQSLSFLSARRSELYKKAARLRKQQESLYSAGAVIGPTLSKITTVQSNFRKMTFTQESGVDGVQNGIESRAFATKAVHAGSPHDPVTGAVIPTVSNNFLLASQIPEMFQLFLLYITPPIAP